MQKYKSSLNYHSYQQNYDPTSDYLNWGKNKKFIPSQMLQFDSKGIPKVKYGDEFHYNPVTVSQFALTVHGRYKRGEDTIELFKDTVAFLSDMQEGSGALPYPFTFHYFIEKYFSLDGYQGWHRGRP